MRPLPHMTEHKVTSSAVAKRAGVSQSAVSRVFTPGASASQATTDKVRKAAAELGYRPNRLARSLITGRTRMIGLVVAYLDNQFYPLALERLSQALQARGYHILIFMAENSTQSVSKVVEELLDYQVDGIITASVDVTGDLAKRCANAGIPIVLFNRGQDEAHLSEVTSDNLAGGRSVAKFLVAGGHKRIVHIAGWQGSSTGRDRSLGFVDALKELGVHNITQIDGMYKREVAAQAARDLFRGPKSPDAVFVGNDHMAFAVLDVLRLELGLSVPNDVSVVGYDDVPLAAWPSFSLTTVRQPLDHMVRTTVDLLLDTIENIARTPAKIRISGPLVLRQSSRIPKGGWPLHQV